MSECEKNCEAISGLNEYAVNLIEYSKRINVWLNGPVNGTVDVGGVQTPTLLNLVNTLKLLNLNSIIQQGGGLSVDQDGKLFVDFTSMPTDKFETLLKSLRLPIWLSEDLHLYVSTTGVDGPGRGTADLPWRTLQYAVDYVSENINVSNYTASIHLAPGTYEENVRVNEYARVNGLARIVGEPGVVLAGDGHGVNHSTIYFLGSHWLLENLKVTQQGTAPTSEALNTNAVAASNGGTLLYLQGVDIEINQARADMGGLFAIFSEANANIKILNGCSIKAMKSVSGGNNKCAGLSAFNNGSILLQWENSAKMNVQGAYENFARSVQKSSILRDALYMSTFSGSATGSRYLILSGSNIDTNGAGQNFFPGNSAGYISEETYCFYV